MTDIAVYTFEDQQVRTLTDANGNPLFVLNDVCRALDISNSRMAAQRLDPDCVSTTDVTDSLGRSRNTSVITEAGLYEVIFQSRKPEAKAFRRWVTSEVLPSIRKTGTYSLQSKLEGPELMAYALIEAQKTIEAATARAEAAEAQIEANKPHTTLGKAITAGDGDLLVRDVARILASHGVNIGEKRLYQWLRDNQWVTKGGGRCGNQPTQRRIEQGLVRP